MAESPTSREEPSLDKEVYIGVESALQRELRRERAEEREKRARTAARNLTRTGQFRIRDRLYFPEMSKEEQVKEIATQGTFAIEELLNADDGVKTARILSKVITGEKQALFAADAERIVKPIGPGVDLIWSFDRQAKRCKHHFKVDEQVPVTERVKTVEAFLEKAEQEDFAFNTAMDEIAAQIDKGASEAYATQPFNLHENLYQMRKFLGPSKLYLGDRGPASDARLVIDTVERLYNLPYHYAHETPELLKKEGIYFDENGRIQKVLIASHRAGVYVALRSADTANARDLTDLPMSPGIEIDAEEVYSADAYDGTIRPDTIPFIETKAAGELLGQFESLGLRLLPQLRNAFTEAEAIGTRFGHGYAYLTREIAKLVDDTERSIRHMFDVQDANGREDEHAVLRKLAQLSGEGSTEAARMVSDMLKDIANRQLGEAPLAGVDTRMALPASDKRIEIKDGSCKDIEVYLTDGRILEGTPLLRSSYIVPTAMCLEPTLFNGVRLPAGSLFRVQDDGTYLFMRITSFAFSPEEALEVFGAQEAEGRANYRDQGNHIRSMMRYE